MDRIYWSDEEEQVMSFLFKNGKTDEEIATLLNRNPQSIRAKRQKLGLRIYAKKIKIEHPAQITTPIAPPKRADNLPDVGDSLVAIINEMELLRGLMIDILHVNQSTMKDVDALVIVANAQLELFKRIDGGKNGPAKSTES